MSYRLLTKLTCLCFCVTIFAQTRPPDSSVTCLPNPVQTEVGRNAILSCQHGGDLSRESVEWRLEWNHHGPTQKTVHVTRNGAEDTHSRADPQYQNRTHLDQNQMTEGRVSLTIFNVSEEDAGNYSCLLHVYHNEDEKIHSGKGYVNLVIVDFGSEDEQSNIPDLVTCSPNPVETEVGRNAILSCQHGGDISRESVEWRLEWNHHGPTQKTVHVTRNGVEDPHSRADLQFQNRTHLDQNQMTKGRVSLTIFNVSEEDAGNYSCLLHIYHTEDEKIHSGKDYVNMVIGNYGNEEEQKTIPVDYGSEDEQRNNPNSNNGAIIGGSVGGAAAVTVVVILLIQRKRRRRQTYIPGRLHRDDPNGENEEPNDQNIAMQEV